MSFPPLPPLASSWTLPLGYPLPLPPYPPIPIPAIIPTQSPTLVGCPPKKKSSKRKRIEAATQAATTPTFQAPLPPCSPISSPWTYTASPLPPLKLGFLPNNFFHQASSVWSPPPLILPSAIQITPVNLVKSQAVVTPTAPIKRESVLQPQTVKESVSQLVAELKLGEFPEGSSYVVQIIKLLSGSDIDITTRLKDVLVEIKAPPQPSALITFNSTLNHLLNQGKAKGVKDAISNIFLDPLFAGYNAEIKKSLLANYEKAILKSQ